ncbi:MAG: Hsp70 family protein [Pirellulales bacterium]
MPTRAVGIDLGTTYSAVAWVADGGHSAMIASAEGDILTPSVVLFEDSGTLVGKAARKSAAMASERFAECVKRDMGSPFYNRAIRGEYLPPEVIQAYILRALKTDIVRVAGSDYAAIITVPAFFDEPRRKATADAGELAGLRVLDIVNEPTAAALAFGEELGYLTESSAPRELQRVLVYDLGGGTFDVTLVELRPADIRTLATDGDVFLGGRDWDERLANYAADEFAQRHSLDPRGDRAVWQRVLLDAEEAKRALTARQQTKLRIEHGGQGMDVPITREVFEEVTGDLLERTLQTTREVLRAGGCQWSDVSRVLLVGGSTRMPAVARCLQELTGLAPDRGVHPDEAVARGAALYARYRLSQGATPGADKASPDKTDETVGGSAPPKTELKITDVNSHSLGIEGIDPETGSPRTAVLIRRNSPLPARKTREFVTKVAGQPSIALTVLEGESQQPAQCTLIGRTTIHNLPPSLPQGWPVKVTYEYGVNGRLNVWARVPGTDREVKLELEREAGLDTQRAARWKKLVEEEAGLDEFDRMIAEELRAAQRKTSGANPAAGAAPAGRTSPPTGSSTAAAPTPSPAGNSTKGNSSAAPSSTPRSAKPGVERYRDGEARDDDDDFERMMAEELLAAGRSSPAAVAAAPAPPTSTPPAESEFQRTTPTDSQEATESQAPVSGDTAAFDATAADDHAAHQATETAARPAGSMRKISRRNATAVMLIGHVIFSLLGLAIGYYVLCWLNPHANFLQLDLPGLP